MRAPGGRDDIGFPVAPHVPATRFRRRVLLSPDRPFLDPSAHGRARGATGFFVNEGSPVRKNSSLAEVLAPEPEPLAAPPDELASLEAAVDEAISRESILGQKSRETSGRRESVIDEIATKKARDSELKRELAFGSSNARTEIEAGKLTIEELEDLRDGLTLRLADEESDRAAAEAEVGQLGRRLAMMRHERECNADADELDAGEAKMWTAAGDLVRLIDRNQHLRERFVERYADGPRIFTERILARRDERRLGAIAAINATGRVDLYRILPFSF